MPTSTNTKAFLETESKQKIPCLFNPADLALSQSNSWGSGGARPGRGVPTLRYDGASSGVLRLTLFFDTTATGTSVTEYTAKLVGLMEPNAAAAGASADNQRPPWVIFHWGTSFHSFKAVVSSLDISFEYFSSDGTPLRAKASVTLTQYEPDGAFGPQNPTSGTPYPHRVHRVQPGETLDRISAMHLGDSTQWRAIAEANGIEDPLALRPGSLLAIPGRF